jgi:hypothetical protein
MLLETDLEPSMARSHTFVAVHFSRLPATIQRDYPDSLFFLDPTFADATVAHNDQSRVMEAFLANPSGDETDIDVKNVTFGAEPGALQGLSRFRQAPVCPWYAARTEA